ncbi:MAG: zf-HC2 domain-containing protein [Fulvivirga sp.]
MGLSSTDSFDGNPSKDSSEVQPNHGQCLKILSLVLDEEASPEEQEYFKKHIENCMPYYQIYNVDKAIKDLIRKKCYDKEVPNDLVEQIKSKIIQGTK